MQTDTDISNSRAMFLTGNTLFFILVSLLHTVCYMYLL